MPKKSKGGDSKTEKEKLPSEHEQLLQTKLNALQAKFDAQVKAAESAMEGQQQASNNLNRERQDRKDHVRFLQAELAKKQDELDAVHTRMVAMQGEEDLVVRQLKGDLEKATDTIAQQELRLEQLAHELSSHGEQLLEYSQLKTNAEGERK